LRRCLSCRGRDAFGGLFRCTFHSAELSALYVCVSAYEDAFVQ
jgi:hypothetical protein